MRLIIFGATGGIGHHVVEQALAAGHEVTAVARRPALITIRHERLKVVQGDVLEPVSFQQALAGQDAVVSAIGIAKDAPTTLYSEGVAHIMDAMRAANVRRILCISASGLEPGPWWQRWVARPILWRLLKYMYTDLVQMEDAVKASDLDWTILRPPRLTNGPHTGRYQFAVNKHLARCLLIPRADVADFILAPLTDQATYCGVVEVAK